MRSTYVSVFEDEYLDDAMTTVTSDPVAVEGNKVIMCVTVKNITGTSLAAKLQGSYDGKKWEDPASNSVTPTSFGYSDIGVGSFDYAFARISATYTASGVTPAVLFDAGLAFSAM